MVKKIKRPPVCVQRCSATSLDASDTRAGFALSSWPTVMCTPSRHRRLVLAYDSNPSSDGSVLVPPLRPRGIIIVRLHHCGVYACGGAGAAAASAAAAGASAAARDHDCTSGRSSCAAGWVTLDASLGRPRVHPAPRRHSEARCNQWKHHRLRKSSKNTDAARSR